MDDMQCGHLIETFAHNEEQRVEEFGELGKEVPPTTAGRSQGKGAIGRIDWLASPTVRPGRVQPSRNARL
jgi:hypothetical protein